MALHAQKKGKRGEVEFCKWLKSNLDIDTERNYNQSDGYSADVIIDDFIFEIKRHENPKPDDFWYQVIVAKKRHESKDLIPVVAFRQNRQRWKFLIPAKLIGVEVGYMQVSEKVFISFATAILSNI